MSMMSMASKMFASLTVALVVLATLAAPGQVYADVYSDCVTSCSSQYTPGSSGYDTCMPGCVCNAQCTGSQNYTTCMSTCYTTRPSCFNCNNGCVGSARPCPYTLYPNLYTKCDALTACDGTGSKCQCHNDDGTSCVCY